ncbi:hypothetical protein Salmuc_00299 [Salipiger mucosus DSM 16094]|uniref:Uncharacterized protein n=1 Tax=Salipiger mucosus DSM 16094 TaxID=1123237 RepID=S9Q9U8_9RHOB|nr:hypothetical protein Salmuc_00299 [Salipiger mucosus DSM 16094]
MARDLLTGMADAQLRAADQNADPLSDQPPRHRVGVTVDLDRAVGRDPADEIATRQEGRDTVGRLEPVGFVPGEAQGGRFTGRAVDTHVRDLPDPGFQMRLERGEALESASGDGIALHVAHAALVLALRPGSVRRAGPDPEAPVSGKGVEPGIDRHLPRHRIMVGDQGAGVVEQHFLRHTAEAAEGSFHALEPVFLALPGEGAHVQPPGVAESGYEEEHLHLRAANLHPSLTEVDLQLLTGAGLEANRGPRFRPQLLPQRRDRPLHGPEADRDALLRSQLLTHHIRVPGVLPKALRHPILQAVEHLRPHHRRRRAPASRSQPSLHGVPRAAEFRRDALRTPPTRLQCQHRRHFFGRPHLDPPRNSSSRRTLRYCFCHVTSFRRGGQFLMSSGGHFSMSPDTCARNVSSRRGGCHEPGISAAAGRCCRTQRVKDSHRESMRLDEQHEQAQARPLPHDELVRLQRCAPQARVFADLAGQGDGLARAA